jgi:hypothetical protein
MAVAQWFLKNWQTRSASATAAFAMAMHADKTIT